MAKGKPYAVCASHKPAYEDATKNLGKSSWIPTRANSARIGARGSLYNCKMGTKVICRGIMSSAMITRKIVSRPRNLSQAKAYAASDPRNRGSRVEGIVIRILLMKLGKRLYDG